MDENHKKELLGNLVKKKNPLKKYVILLTVAAAAALAFAVFTGYSLLTRAGGGMTPQGIREIAELSTLEYRYRDVIAIVEEEEFKLFGLWDVNPGEHILIVRYDGVIRLGIDCEKILFNEYNAVKGEKRRIEIKLPDVELISSETPMDSFEVIMNRGVYTNKTVDMSAFFAEAAKRQETFNADALDGELADAARENAKKQLQGMFESFDEIRENYEIIWVD